MLLSAPTSTTYTSILHDLELSFYSMVYDSKESHPSNYPLVFIVSIIMLQLGHVRPKCFDD